MDYISLKEATKYCDYSQDYLKLRARQGKLKATKIGRNWVTTPEWVEEYNNKIPNSKAHCSHTAQIPNSLFAHLKFHFPKCHCNVRRTVLLTLVVILVAVGVWVNFGIFSEYFQWQTANVGGVFEAGAQMIPGRVIEVR